MSRSYRKPWYNDGYGTNFRRWHKRYANRTVGRAVNVPNGKAYKKYYDSYDICDFRYEWDPWTSYYWYWGEMKVIEPEPLWRVNRK